MDPPLSDEIVERLEDLSDAIDLLEKFHISYDEVESLQQAKQKLHLNLRDIKETRSDSKAVQNDEYKITAENSARFIQHLMEGTNTVRQQLQDLVKRCVEVVRKLPPVCLNELNTAFPGVIEELELCVKNLERNECVILVAGETGSGKSTLLNLLLGQITIDLLPVAHLSSTSVICELKYSEEKKIIVFPKDVSEGSKTISIESNAAEIISGYVHHKGDRKSLFEYSRVVVHWPCEWLKGGITVVDSPGVGEDPELTEMVKKYLPEAFGFIYVINTPNAGGMDPDRLQDLIFSHRLEQEKGESGLYDPRSAIFVCNKWDNVPFEERQQVKEYAISQLKKAWPGFTEDQVFFMAAKLAKERLGNGHVTSDFRDLLQGIERLIPFGVKKSLGTQYESCLQILERCMLVLQTCMSDVLCDAQSNKEKIKLVKEHLEWLLEKPETLKGKLSKQIESSGYQTLKKLKDYLLHCDTIERLSKWSEMECQPMMNCNSLEILKEKMRAKVFKRIKCEINDWDSKNRFFEMIQYEISESFKREFQLIEEERRKIELNFVNDTTGLSKKKIDENGTRQEENPHESWTFFTFGWNLASELAAPIWVPIGLVVGLASLPFVGFKAWYNRSALEDAKEDIQQQMADLTSTMLNEVTESNGLSKVLKGHLALLMSSICGMLEHIPLLIEADQRMIINMEKEGKCTEDDLENLYRPLLDDTKEIIRKLNVVYFKGVPAYDIDFRNLTYMTSVFDGNYSRVHRAQLHTNSSELPRTVAIKQMINPIKEDNVAVMLFEEGKIRALKAPNIVKFYGTSVRQVGDNTFILLVTEYCEKTLAKVICEDGYCAPGESTTLSSTEYVEATRTAANFAQQVASGLHVFHHRDFLHGNLKPENIFVNNNGIVKLAVKTRTQTPGSASTIRESPSATSGRNAEIPVTASENPIYGSNMFVAAEVQHERKSTKMSDMFSYGMVMWVLWRGKKSLNEVNSHEDIFELALSSIKIDPVWKQLMKKCLEMEPEKRPTAEHCSTTMAPFTDKDSQVKN